MANRIPVITFVLMVVIVCVAIRNSDAIDCRRFVFAPRCRGVSAKRAQIPPLDYRELHRGNRFSLSARRNNEARSDEQEDYDSHKTSDFLRSLLQEYWSQSGASNEVDA